MSNIDKIEINAANGDSTDGFGLSCFTKHPKDTVKMVSGKYDFYYKMESKNRGVAVILNHEYFEIPKLKQRNGTNEDKKNLEISLQNLGFDVHSFDDLTTSGVIGVLDKYANMDHKDNDCFVMCILTHGDAGCLYSKNSPYKHDDIFDRFTADKCKSLAGKPKLFFIQACQGDNLDAGISVTQTDGSPHYRIPIHADFLIAYSTIPGYYSWRNTTRGSWFVQSLCEVFNNYAYEYDLLSLLTLVNQKVALDFESNVPGDKIMHAQKQIPYITFMLMRIVKFDRKPSMSSQI